MEQNRTLTEPILTIAVPTYNMERFLREDLESYCAPALRGRLEVLILNNASTDASADIAREFCSREPDIFRLIDRGSRGYGGSINDAQAAARGTYFRIVDADDWVNTAELVRFTELLQTVDADVVLSDYCVVSMSDGGSRRVSSSAGTISAGTVVTDLRRICATLPCIHSTTYHTGLLRKSGFFMQDGIFFVDEEYVILPYLRAKNVLYTDCDVYRYRVDNPAQSTSPKNRAKFLRHREQILKRLIEQVGQAEGDAQAEESGGLAYCRDRVSKGIGDHFTTLYLYVSNRKEGRGLAKEWAAYVQKTAPEYWPSTKKKAAALALLNRFHVSLALYAQFKRLLIRQ